MSKSTSCWLFVGISEKISDLVESARHLSTEESGIMDMSVEEALNIAVKLHQQGNLPKAKKFYVAILTSTPDHPQALNLLGLIEMHEGNLPKAQQLLTRSIQADSNNADAHNNLGLVYYSMEDYGQALQCYEKALLLKPTSVEALVNIGGCYLAEYKHEMARGYFEKALVLNPGQVDAISNLGKISFDQGDFAKAIKYYHHALKLNPSHVEAINNLGDVHLRRGDTVESLAFFEQALQVNPQYVDAHLNRAVALLLLGRFDEGWHEYQWRISVHSGQAYRRDPRNMDNVLPRPSELLPIHWQDKKILLLEDQGLGDEIFFLRYAPLLLAKGTQLMIRPSPKLLPIFERLELCQSWDLQDKPNQEFDHIFAIGDLPLLTEMRSVDDIAGTLRLAPRGEFKEQLSLQYQAYPRPWTGISWRAGTVDSHKSLYKEVPLDELILSLADMPGTIFSLQRSPKDNELSLLERAFGDRFVECEKINEELENALALLDLLDEYICVSNTNVHLRVLLGKHCRVLVPLASEFRWLATGDESPWFPGSTIYRQTRLEDAGSWQPALEKLAKVLVERSP